MDASLRVLSAGAPRLGVQACAEAFGAIALDFATAPVIEQRLRESPPVADVVIAPRRVVATAVRDARVRPDPLASIGVVSAAVVVNTGSRLAQVDSVTALRAALLGASEIVFNRASSGRHMERVLERLDLGTQLEGKCVRVDNGAAVVARIAADADGTAVGIGQSTEIRRLAGQGVRVGGLVPAELGALTAYLAALVCDTPRARAFIAFLDTPQARDALAAAGVIPGDAPA